MTKLTYKLIHNKFKLDGVSHSSKTLLEYLKNNEDYYDFLTSYYANYKSKGENENPPNSNKVSIFIILLVLFLFVIIYVYNK